MSMVTLIVLQSFIAGPAGLIARTNIAAFLLSTESVDSPRLVRRWSYRYLVFSLHFMLSFMLTHLLVAPAFEYLSPQPLEEDAEALLYGLACIPLAAGLYFLDHRFMQARDAAKLAGRERFRQKWGR